MRILEIETYGRGGLTHYAHNLSRALAERGHDVTLVTAACYELDDRPLPDNVRVIKAMARWSHGARLPSFALGLLRKLEAVHDGFAVARIARRERPDVIHLHCTHSISLLHLELLRRLRRKLVATAHVVTPHERVRFQRAVYGAIHRRGDLIVAHSRVDSQRLVDEFGVDPGRVTVIPHGDYGFFEAADGQSDRTSARRRLGLEPADEVALFFGYVREYKGLDVLLDAWPRVAAARPRARLVVAGDPVRLPAARRRELEDRMRELGAVNRFGYVPFADVGDYFAAADTLVMPYRRISQSGVLFLALSLGVPVVATTVGALPEMLRDGESALLVPPESPDALAHAIGRTLGCAELRRRLGEGGRAVAARCSWESIAEQTERAFARVLGAPNERT